MEQQKNIWYVTLLLSSVAGFCDTATFVAADSIFSAHVTGNFIVFAYQMVKGSDAQAWVKLLTFPVFVISVMVGGWMATRVKNRYTLLFTEGLILITAGILFVVLTRLGFMVLYSWLLYLLAMVVVFAMGIQNAFGKLYAKETHGPTTMMTGNVTQASLDLGTLLTSGFKNEIISLSFKKQLDTISGFLIGCLLGALMGKEFGLACIILPGLGMVICYIFTKSSNE
ncbi:YoaK family protein [Dyadobacter sp. 3J3]|uniref:YoaK family protein n=1 Tax=Dyadobacter sp. 3J3 TaxID=2606600 RepID=UPI00135BD1C1|nr:YoaK family protein [Dyadobacter sp. 3J3]